MDCVYETVSENALSKQEKRRKKRTLTTFSVRLACLFIAFVRWIEFHIEEKAEIPTLVWMSVWSSIPRFLISSVGRNGLFSQGKEGGKEKYERLTISLLVDIENSLNGMENLHEKLLGESRVQH